ncbi:MAG: sigma-70 family RNA polymerase sigma factor [Pseudomonadota bacterium]
MGVVFSFVDELEQLLPEMRAFARSLCRDKTLADDLVQDACLKAWDKQDSFDPEQAMRPWLFRIIRNEFYMGQRRAWRNVQAEPEAIASALTAECDLETRHSYTEAIEAIYALPDKQRDALILVLAAGYTYQEAGEICDCSAGTMKSRVSRAREALQVSLDLGSASFRATVIKGGLETLSDRVFERLETLQAERLAA